MATLTVMLAKINSSLKLANQLKHVLGKMTQSAVEFCDWIRSQDFQKIFSSTMLQIFIKQENKKIINVKAK